MGGVEETIIRQCQAEKLPLPEKIQNAPSLWLGCELYYLAFMDLTTCRQLGFGIQGPISYLDIAAYCSYHGFSEETTNAMQFILPRVDQFYLDYWAKKSAAKEKKPLKRNKG